MKETVPPPVNPRLSSVDFAELCLRLGLKRIFETRGMYGGDCPICGGDRCFFVWLEKEPVRVVCYKCGLDISVRRNAMSHWVKNPNINKTSVEE